MTATFSIRTEERNDVRALAIVRVQLMRNGYRILKGGKIRAHRNGGLWQYVIPVEEHISH